MSKLSTTAFAAFLLERCRAKDGYIMGAIGEDPRSWKKTHWRFAQYKDRKGTRRPTRIRPFTGASTPSAYGTVRGSQTGMSPIRDCSERSTCTRATIIPTGAILKARA